MPLPEQYVPKRAGPKQGSRGVDVERLQAHLARFGYLDSPQLREEGVSSALTHPEPDTKGTFDQQTEDALRTFQRFVGLEETGELDQATVSKMEEDRCGNYDIAPQKAPDKYVLSGCKWSTTNLRYGFQNFTGDLTQSQIRSAFVTAFAMWSGVTPLSFTEVAVSQSPELLVRFGTGNHGGCPFTFTGELAHNFYPPDCGGNQAGDGHYNDQYTWSTTVPVPSGQWDLTAVAAHEIGHGLGLAHSTISGALMYPYISAGSAQRQLHQDDIDGIQAIYGAAQWLHNRKITRLFVSHHSQNCWANIESIGWRKVESGSNDGVTNMFAALAAARADDVSVSVYVENNTIRQMYL